MALDLREMSFQNVMDTILKPAGVKVGGFPEEIFLDLTDEEKNDWTCGICYLIANDCRECDNKHLFCNTCVFAWSMTYGENSQKCPMCRCDQKKYNANKDLSRKLDDKRVKCPEQKCTFKSPLKIFLMHSHGKLQYSNSTVDLESLRPVRPQGASMIFLPNLLEIASRPADRMRRGVLIRNQLQQGRMMINQMMMLLHLEMQLRHQALVSYQQAANAGQRAQRMDEVMALNEQLNEVGTILTSLLDVPLNQATPATQTILSQSQASPGNTTSDTAHSTTTTPTINHILNTLESDDDDDDDSDSDDSTLSDLDAPTVINRNPVPSLSTTLTDGQQALDRARERRNITQQILADDQGTTPAPTQQSGLLNRTQAPQNRLSSQETEVADNTIDTNARNSNSVHLPALSTNNSQPGRSEPEAPTPSDVIPTGSASHSEVMRSLTSNTSTAPIPRRSTNSVQRQSTSSSNVPPRESNNEANRSSSTTNTSAAAPSSSTQRPSDNAANNIPGSGNILPASLYRRRSRPSVNPPAAQTDNNHQQQTTSSNTTGTAPRILNRRQNESRTYPLNSRTVDALSQVRTNQRATNPTNRANRPAPVTGTAARPRAAAPPIRRGSRSTASSSQNSQYSQGMPTTQTGEPRARRRSEIHLQLLMRNSDRPQ